MIYQMYAIVNSKAKRITFRVCTMESHKNCIAYALCLCYTEKDMQREAEHMNKRDINVDLSRIIAAVFVVVLHVLGQGGVLDSTSPGETKYWAAWFLEILALCAVNCFALISGYVMVNKSIKAKNIVSLWFHVLFYSVLISAIFFVFLPETRSKTNLLIAVLPIVGKQWWYISSYFALLFFMPFLNAAANHLSQQIYKKCLIMVLIGICCIDCVIPIDAFILSEGYSTIWLMIVYLFGAYIRKYDIRLRITALKSILGFFSMIILTFLSKIAITFLTNSIFGQTKHEDIFISYISITILLAAVFLLLFCLNIRISNLGAKLICFFSPVTLGVYLIHVHPFVFDFVIKDAFSSFAHKPVAVMLLSVVIATISIFGLCTAIELARIQFFKLIRVNCWSENIGNAINKLFLRVFKNI